MNKFNKFLVIFVVVLSLTGFYGRRILLGSEDGRVLVAENRVLTKMPKWEGSHSREIVKYFKELDQYISDRLILKNFVLTYLTPYIEDRNYFTQSDDTKVVFGKNGWVFLGNNYDQTLDKHFSPTDLSLLDKNVKGLSQKLLNIKTLSNEVGASLHLLIGPDKPTVYCKNFPDWRKMKSCNKVSEWTDLTLLRLIEQGYSITYPKNELRKASQDVQVYYKTDTHWNSKGAEVAFLALMRDINNERSVITPFTNYSFKYEKSSYRGDLAKISGLGEKLEVLNSQIALLQMPNIRIIWTQNGKTEEVSLMRASSGAKKNFIAKMKNHQSTTDKKVVVLCDSFMTAMSPFFNSTFREVLYISRHRDIETIRNETKLFKPDFIIYESVERGLR